LAQLPSERLGLGVGILDGINVGAEFVVSFESNWNQPYTKSDSLHGVLQSEEEQEEQDANLRCSALILGRTGL
jgi:hypothetical protein